MKKASSRQQGFTLIELVIVIIILGILSASAIPKFVNLQSDAKKAVLSGIEGSIRDAANMAHYKLLLSGKSATDQYVDMPLNASGTQKVTMWGGYPHVGSDPDGDGIPDEGDIASLLDISSDIEVIREGDWFNGIATFALGIDCHVKYSEAVYSGKDTGNITPHKIERVDTGC